MIDITCPRCGRPYTLNAIEFSGDEFCEKGCDYPLFWAIPATPGEADERDGARYRLPGTGGRMTIGRRLCRDDDCREPNPLTGEFCIRCGLALDPPPPEPQVEPEPEPEPEPPAPPPPPPPPPPEPTWPLWLAWGVGLVTAALLFLVLPL